MVLHNYPVKLFFAEVYILYVVMFVKAGKVILITSRHR